MLMKKFELIKNLWRLLKQNLGTQGRGGGGAFDPGALPYLACLQTVPTSQIEATRYVLLFERH